MRPTLGIDPGLTNGAVVLLDGFGQIAHAASWKRRARTKEGRHWSVWQVTSSSLTPVEVPTLMAAIDEALQMAGTDYLLVVETITPNIKASGGSIVALAEAAGLALGLAWERSVDSVRVPSFQWRRDQLGEPTDQYRDGRKVNWDAWALHRFKQTFRADLDIDRRLNEHAVDAAWIARWGWCRQKEVE